MCAVLLLASSPALAQEREWTLDASEDEAFMIFGVPETDDVGVSFWCALRSGEVRMFIPEASESLAANTSVDIDLKVGGKDFRFKASTMPNEEAGSISTESLIPVTDPFFAALRDVDSFTVKVAGETLAFPLAGADLRGLLEACGTP